MHRGRKGREIREQEYDKKGNRLMDVANEMEKKKQKKKFEENRNKNKQTYI